MSACAPVSRCQVNRFYIIIGHWKAINRTINEPFKIALAFRHCVSVLLCILSMILWNEMLCSPAATHSNVRTTIRSPSIYLYIIRYIHDWLCIVLAIPIFSCMFLSCFHRSLLFNHKKSLWDEGSVQHKPCLMLTYVHSIVLYDDNMLLMRHSFVWISIRRFLSIRKNPVVS